MSFLEELSQEEMLEALKLLGESHLPVALTVQYRERWITFPTCAIAQHKGILWVEQPDPGQFPKGFRFRIGERVGVSFSTGHRKFVFAGRVGYLETYRLEDAPPAEAVRLDRPERMLKVRRRLHDRIELPFDELTRATFWLGGWEAQPAEATVETPTWSGRVLNISQGGMLVRTTYEAAKYLEVGDMLGVLVTFGSEEQAALIDAQLRHCAPDGEMALMGLQFVQVEGDEQGAGALELIHRKIAERAGELKQQAVAV